MASQVNGATKTPVRLAFVCAGDPLDVLTWSGTPHHMLNALKAEFDVRVVVRGPWPPWFSLVRRALRLLTRGAIDIYWSKTWTKMLSARAVAEVARSDCDVVVAVAITPVCAQLIQHRPTIFVSDATLAAMVEYNPRHRALAPWVKRSAEALETYCIQHAMLSVFPSAWAARSALSDHGGLPDRVLQIPWGRNLAAKAFIAPEQRSETEWRLLFVGTNWMGKGGDIALTTVAEMRRRGHSVHIDVVGSAPEDMSTAIEGVTFHGFLNKNVDEDLERLLQLYASAHIFFLPTQFEALGIVFAEAASFAMPAVSYRTGGVPSTVMADKTGVLLEAGATAEDFAEVLISLLRDRSRYIAMCHSAQEFSRRLDWAVWATEMRRAVEDRLVAEGRR